MVNVVIVDVVDGVVVDVVGLGVVVGAEDPFLVKKGASWLTSTSEKTVSWRKFRNKKLVQFWTAALHRGCVLTSKPAAPGSILLFILYVA